jgi:membrane protease YdiL (CAAX protease family)
VTGIRVGLISGAVLTASFVAWLTLHPLPWAARTFATALLVPLPALLVLQGRLVAELPRDPERESLYLSSAISVWVLAAVAMLAARASDFSRGDLRLVSIPAPTLVIASALTILAGCAVMGIGKMLRIRESPIVHFLLPRSGPEKIAFVGLSFSAGIAEELVFRSFLIAALFRALDSMPLAVALSVTVFAAAHAYQGLAGALRVAILGLILTAPFLITGSVYPSVIAHVALDLIAGLVLAEWLSDSPTTG